MSLRLEVAKLSNLAGGSSKRSRKTYVWKKLDRDREMGCIKCGGQLRLWDTLLTCTLYAEPDGMGKAEPNCVEIANYDRVVY